MTMTATARPAPPEALGYGTLLVLDGAFAVPDTLTGADVMQRTLRRMAEMVEPDPSAGANSVSVLLDDHDGHSVALVDGETCAVAHAFPHARTVSVRLFSPREVPLDRVTTAFHEAFKVGRFQSAVRDHATLLPRDEAGLRRHLAGDRAYTRLRLTPDGTATPVP
ncbi:MAG: hypothetical protein R6W77_14870 [Trueperaceae bacterium]